MLKMQKNAFGKAKFPTKRRIMRTWKMTEISGVDNPAQPHAVAVLVKSAPAADPQEFCKIAFREALENQKFDRAFSDAFYNAFDGLWLINDAFRTALSDRYQNNEQTLADYIAEVTALATRTVETVGSLQKTEIGAFAKAVVEATKTQQETAMFKTVDELKAAIAKFAKSGGTDAEIQTIKDSAVALGAETELPAEGALAITPTEKRLAEAEAELAKMRAVSDLTPVERKHYDSLKTPEEKSKFLMAKADERTAEIEKAAGDDPVAYTCADGTEIRKSAGPVAIMLAKRADEQDAEIRKLRDEQSQSEFAKRAATEFPNLPAASTAALLKAAASLSADEQTAAIEGLTAQNAAAAKNFGFRGSAGAVSKGSGDAEAKLDEMAKSLAAKSGKTFEAAYADALQTPEGAALYAELSQN